MKIYIRLVAGIRRFYFREIFPCLKEQEKNRTTEKIGNM